LGTQRGKVVVFGGASALAMFGEVDTPDEAMWLVQAQSVIDSPCTLRRPASVTPFTAGFDLEFRLEGAGEMCAFGSSRGTRIDGFIVTLDGKVTHRTGFDSGGCWVPSRARFAAGLAID
jgi:hypothetical protein